MSASAILRTLAVALGAVAVAQACASLDQPAIDSPPLADGVAPYRGDLRVEVCFGSARVVERAPITRAVGACRPEDATPAACATRADCRERESCVCARCTAQICQFNSDCPTGLTCGGTGTRRCMVRCENDADCADGLVCFETGCAAPCADTAECVTGELCLGGRCTVIGCGDLAAKCGTGEVCDAQVREGKLYSPSVHQQGDESVLYVEVEEALAPRAILRATSRDGLRFTAAPDRPVLSAPAGWTAVGAPAVLVGDGVTLYVELDGGAALGVTRAADGVSFGAVEQILAPSEAWEDGRVAAPSAVQVGGRTLLFYEGGAGAGVGLATAPGPVGPFTRQPGGPLLAPTHLEDPRHWNDLSRIGAPAALVTTTAVGDRVLRVFFEADGVEDTAATPPDAGGAPSNASIGVAITEAPGAGAAVALAPFLHNPVLGQVKNLAPVSEHGPAVLRVGHEWRMYYESGGVLRLATHPPR